MQFGIQLYSVRDQLDKDFTGTLRELAAMGFQGVEFAGNYGDMSPGELADFLPTTGLVCCGLHLGLDDLQDADSTAYQYAKAVNSKFVTTSCCGKQYIDTWPTTITSIAKAGEVAASLGLQFTYHNHAQEFERRNGETLLDTLYAQTAPDSVKAELDTAWISAGGGDPESYIRTYSGRVPQVHAKDYAHEKETLIEIGRGDLDFKAIIAAARDSQAEWLIYELDASTIGDSMRSAREAGDVLKPLL